MKCRVLKVTETGKHFNVVHVHIPSHNLYGNCLSSVDVKEPGEYEIISTLMEKQGRIVSLIMVGKVQ